MALNTSSQQQASRMARMEIELRRMHAVSLRHFVEKERVVSGRSLQYAFKLQQIAEVWCLFFRKESPVPFGLGT